jgi:SAM-dependent methyltransferase
MDLRRNPDVIVETIAPQGKRIIDVGCGDGGLTRHLAKHGARVLGVECGARQLAKARAADPVANADIVEGVGQALPVADGEADVVVFANSLHHIPPDHMAQALVEAARALKPGGIVYISEPIAEGAFFETAKPVDDETEVRALAQAAIAAAAAAGLEQTDEFRYLHPIEMAAFEDFHDRIVSANAEREEKFQAMETDLRALFQRNARRSATGGHRFDQPMRINILRKS